MTIKEEPLGQAELELKWYRDLDKLFMKEFGVSHMDVEDYDWQAEIESDNPPQDAYDEWYLIAGPGSMI